MTVVRRRRMLQAVLDMSAWYVAYAAAIVLTVEVRPYHVAWEGTVVVASVAAALQLLLGYGVHLYRGRYEYGSFDEVRAVAETAVLVSLTTEAYVVWTGIVPPARTVAAGVVALVGMLGLRYVVRLVNERRRRPSETAEPVVVFGAGDAGRQLIRALQLDPASPFRVVALLDDDPALRNLEILGTRVTGGRDLLRDVVERTGARLLAVALPNADAALLRVLHAEAASLGIAVKVLPSLHDLPDGTVTPFHLRDINEEDLLGRRAVHTDLTGIGQLLHGRRVLITGAGGSIGSELARQVHRFEPAAMALLDRDENGLHATQLSIQNRALLDDEYTIVGCIRDADRMHEVFSEFRPEIVFHAAALKHLPLMEKYPGEAAKTNVLGTLNVLRAAQEVGVARFVNISTDKAANPVSVLGYSKRITERLTAAVGQESVGTFVSVRFGNVLGSHGSVLHSFAAQIADGGPVTVTHPDITRYFMTIPEAVQLVLQSAAIGQDGEILVLDMGEPVRIADVAAHLIRQSGRDIPILFTGMRAGEKLDEDLFARDEVGERRCHELIYHVSAPPLQPSSVDAVDVSARHHELIESLRDLAESPSHASMHGVLRAVSG